jgi:hypothetical protein
MKELVLVVRHERRHWLPRLHRLPRLNRLSRLCHWLLGLLQWLHGLLLCQLSRLWLSTLLLR